MGDYPATLSRSTGVYAYVGTVLGVVVMYMSGPLILGTGASALVIACGYSLLWDLVRSRG